MIQFGLGGALLTLLFVGFYLISVGLTRLSEGRQARTWFTCGLGLLALLFLTSIVGTFTFLGENMGGFHSEFGGRRGIKMAAAALMVGGGRHGGADMEELAARNPQADVMPAEIAEEEMRILSRSRPRRPASCKRPAKNGARSKKKLWRCSKTCALCNDWSNDWNRQIM